MSMLRLSIFSSLLLMAVTMQSQIRMVATTDARQVVAGQYFTVTFTLENARGSSFQPPSFIDFDVAGGPSTSTQMTIINGRRQQKMSYSYSLSSDKVGKYEIGVASIIVSGKKYASEPLMIEVVKGRTNTNGSSAVGDVDFVIEAVVSGDTGYVGQQITLKYVLLTNQDVRSYNFNSLPKFDGFFAQEIQNYQSRPELVVRDGVQYYSRVLKVIALFPQQRGRFAIDHADITLGVSDGRRSNSFFFNTRLKQYRARSTTANVEILEMPSGAPISFSGAVGDFYLGTAVDKKTLTMDDAVTLTLQVKGFGDGKFIEAPMQPYTELFDIYDPNLLQEKSEVVGDRIQVIKTYEYLMIPKRTGTIKFNPELSYYNVDSAKYETIYGQQYRVNVIKGNDRALADLENDIVELEAPGPVKNVYEINNQFACSWGHMGANGLLLAGLVGLLLVRKAKDARDMIDPAVKRNLRAKKIAVQKLSFSKEALDKGDITNFYIRMRQGLQEYLSNKTNQPTNQLSKETISNLLSEYHLEAHLEGILRIMEKGEQAIYASIAPGQESDDYMECLDIISAIEDSLSSERV